MKIIIQCLAALGLAATPVFASGISYTCGSGVTANDCTALTAISNQYAAVFSDANANIYIQFAAIPGDVASTNQYLNTISYSQYHNALVATESGANDVTAVASLGGGTTNPVVNGEGVAVTSALDAALGLTSSLGSQIYGITSAGNPCQPVMSAGCYNAVITLSNTESFYIDGSGNETAGQYDFMASVEHETDEALGTVSCLVASTGGGAQTNGCANSPQSVQGVGAADLFRYAAPGVRSYVNTSNGTSAYFSINGGVTSIASYNNSPNSADYGDWSTSCKYVQDAYGCPGGDSGMNIENDGGVELSVLDAVGYSLTDYGKSLTGDLPAPVAAPEPGAVTLAISGIAWIGIRSRRSLRQRKSAKAV